MTRAALASEFVRVASDSRDIVASCLRADEIAMASLAAREVFRCAIEVAQLAEDAIVEDALGDDALAVSGSAIMVAEIASEVARQMATAISLARDAEAEGCA